MVGFGLHLGADSPELDEKLGHEPARVMWCTAPPPRVMLSRLHRRCTTPGAQTSPTATARLSGLHTNSLDSGCRQCRARFQIMGLKQKDPQAAEVLKRLKFF